MNIDDNSNVVQKNPMSTRRCAHPRCDEVIYRDTLDKDLGYQLPEINGKFFCSKMCALEVLGNKIYFNMTKAGARY